MDEFHQSYYYCTYILYILFFKFKTFISILVLVPKGFAAEIALCIQSILAISYVALLEIRIYKLTKYNLITFLKSE